MTVERLIELLRELDPYMPVVMATQPAWPLEMNLRHRIETHDGVAYLAEAGQLGYLPSEVCSELGWR